MLHQDKDVRELLETDIKCAVVTDSGTFASEVIGAPFYQFANYLAQGFGLFLVGLVKQLVLLWVLCAKNFCLFYHKTKVVDTHWTLDGCTVDGARLAATQQGRKMKRFKRQRSLYS